MANEQAIPLVMVGPTAGHAPRKWLRVVPHDSGRIDPAQSLIECEAPDCHTPVVPEHSHSFVVVLTMATTGAAPAPGAFQCGHEQHFCCSPVCAMKATVACMAHLIEECATRRGNLPAATAAMGG